MLVFIETSLLSIHTTAINPPLFLTCMSPISSSVFLVRCHGACLFLWIALSFMHLFSSLDHQKLQVRTNCPLNSVSYTFDFSSHICNSGKCCDLMPMAVSVSLPKHPLMP
jgi:hypothetical protein